MAETSFAKDMPRVVRLAARQHSLRTEARATRSQWTPSFSTTAFVHNSAIEKQPATAGVPPFSILPQSRVSRLEALQKAKPFSEFLTDTFNRQHDYLRISITERCNLRCVYCMPAEGVPLSPPAHLLTTPEIFYLSSLFVSQGVTKIRLTGGEPTVRKDIIPLMQRIGSLRSKGLREIALTTNGLLLHRKLDAMVEAGLTGVNMSLDTLDPFQFQIMTRRKGFDVVMRGIDRILEMNRMGAGIKLKTNCVVMRGVNEREILPFVEMGMEKDIEVRFIEYMPFGGNKWSKGKMLSYQEMLEIIRTKYPGVHRVRGHKNDTSKTFKVPGFVGRIGFITSMTEDFCGSCNRLRITGDGNLKVCLHGNAEVSLRDMLRAGNDGKPIDEEAFETIKQRELDRNQGRLPEGTSLGWGQREQSLLNLIDTAVKRKKEKHAGMGDLEKMENRPMILIDESPAEASINIPSLSWITQSPHRLPPAVATFRRRRLVPSHNSLAWVPESTPYVGSCTFSTGTFWCEPETRERISRALFHQAGSSKNDREKLNIPPTKLNASRFETTEDSWRLKGYPKTPVDSKQGYVLSIRPPRAHESTTETPRSKGPPEHLAEYRGTFDDENPSFRPANVDKFRARTSPRSTRPQHRATWRHAKVLIRRANRRSNLSTRASDHDFWYALSSEAFEISTARPRSLKAWEWRVHHLKNRVNTVFATVARQALPLARREIWRICKGLTPQDLLEPEAKGFMKPVTRSQVQEAVAEMGQRRRDLVDRTGKDPAIIFPVPESAGITATTNPEVAAPKPQRPREILDENKHDAREYEDPFHISKMLLKRAEKERVERARRGVYRGNRRLDEFESSLVRWRQELYTIAQAISDRFEERKKGKHVPESYMSRCSDIFARVRYIDVGIKQLEHAVQAAKIARRAYMNSPARGRAERAALKTAEERQPNALRRARAIMAMEKTVESLLYLKLPDWRDEISTVQQKLTGIPLQRGTVHICFGLKDKVHAISPARAPARVPLSRKQLKRKIWGMQLDLNRLLKHDLPSWRAEIGLPPYDPVKGLPDTRATHMHFRPQSQIPVDARLPDMDGVEDAIGMARQSIRLHILVYIQTAINLLESELAIWSHEVHAIEERRTHGTSTSSVYAPKSVQSRGATSHVSKESDHERLYTLEAYKRRFKRKLTSTFGFGMYLELDQLRFEDVSDVAKRKATFSRIYQLVKRQRLRYGADVTEEPTKLSESEAQQWKDGVASLLSNHQMLPLSKIPGATSDLVADALRRGESRTSLMRTLLDMLSLRRRAAEDGRISDVEHNFAARFRDASVTRWRRDFKVAMRNMYGFGRDYSIMNSLDYEDLCFAKQRRLFFWKLSDMTRKGHACFRIYNVKTAEAARSEMARWKLVTKLQLRTSFGPGEYSEVDDVSMDTFRHDQRRSGFLLDLFRRLIHRQSIEASTGPLPQQQRDQNPEIQPRVRLSRHQRARKRRAQATSLVIKIETQRRGDDTLNSKQADVESEMQRKQNAILQELREVEKRVATETEDFEVPGKQMAIEMTQAQYREIERKSGKMKTRRVGRQMIEKLRALQVMRLARSNQAQSITLTKEEEAFESGPFFYEYRLNGEETVAETKTMPQHDPDTLEATSSFTAPSLAEPETSFSLENEREQAMARLRKLLLGKKHAQEARNVIEMSEATMAHSEEQRDAKFIVTTATFKPTESRWAPLRQTMAPDESATTGLTKEPNVEARQQRQSHGHLTHLTQSGSAHMVNITPKTSTHRLAVAIGTVSFSNAETLGLVRSAALKKGDVLGVTRIAGIQAAKLCPMIIPLCHPIAISGVEVDVTVLDAVPASQEDKGQSQSHTKQVDKGVFHPPSNSRSLTATSIPLEYGGIHVVARVDSVGPTGVEMEALTAVMGACLTVIDMVKAVDRSASIGGVKVIRKMGGGSGDWVDEAHVEKWGLGR